MKKFLLVTLLFLIPVLIFFGFMEYHVRTNTFGKKQSFLENNLSKIEVLALGSSLSQSDLNPRLIKNKICANLSFGGQPIPIDYYLVDKYIDKMPNLKTVIFELSAHRYYIDLNPDDWNGHIYKIHYGINYNVERFSTKNYFLILSNWTFFSKIFFDFLDPKSEKQIINKYGFYENDFKDKFYKLNYDSAKIDTSFKVGFNFEGEKFKSNNELFHLKLIERCRNKGIKVVYITPPYYKTYLKILTPQLKLYIDSIAKKHHILYQIEYFSLATDKDFKINDFKDDQHLNPNGAIKFSKKIDNILKQQ